MARHFKETVVEPFAAVGATDVDRQRATGLGETDAPLGLVALTADPDFARFAVGTRIPAEAEADADDLGALVNHEVRGLRVAAEERTHFVELVTFADDVRGGGEFRMVR